MVFFSSLLILGYKRQLDGSKLWDLNESEQAKPLLDTFYRNWVNSAKK